MSSSYGGAIVTGWPVTEARARFAALDRLRGLIMVLMALDHANHFLAQRHSSGEYWGGPVPTYPSTLAFVTRLVTHLAAPGFFFLMGAGLLLLAKRREQEGWDRRQIRKHLGLRGGLLVALQLLVVNRAWELSPGGWQPQIYIGVLAALGMSMILGGLLVETRPALLLLPAVLLVAATELLTPAPERWTQVYHPLLRLLLIPGGSRLLWVNYPLLPWLGVTLFGMGFGRWLAGSPETAFRRALWTGAGFLILFAPLRWLDGPGNIRSLAFSDWTSFLNLVKYPPSLTFLLLTLGLDLLLLWLFSRLGDRRDRVIEPLAVFGRVPLFFYLAHLFLYAGIGRLFIPGGTTLPVMYLFWMAALGVLYPLCLWYGRLKQRRPGDALLRLF